MREILTACRNNFGPLPRQISRTQYNSYLKMDPPIWLLFRPFDRIWSIYKNQRTLLERGRIVWGAIVQANTLLFEQGSDDCPAMALFSEDPFYEDNLDALVELAHELFALKSRRPYDAESSRFASVITNELDRSMMIPVPRSLAQGRTAYANCIMVHRPHLPGQFLNNGFFPMLVLPEATSASMILPSRFWPEPFRQKWLERTTDQTGGW